LVAYLQFGGFAAVVHVEWRHFDTKLVKFPVKLSNFRHETEAVLVSQIDSDLLVDTGVLAHKSRKESRTARRFGKRPHDIVGLKKRDLIDARKPCLKIQPRQLSHRD